MLTILLVVLLVILLGGGGPWAYRSYYAENYGPPGIVGLLLIVLLVALILRIV